MMIIRKMMVFALIFAIMIVIKEILNFVKVFMTGEKLDMPVNRQIILASAISYIFTIIFTGFEIL